MSEQMTERPIAKQESAISNEVAIQITEMHKWYGEFHVLKNINLTSGAKSAWSSSTSTSFRT